MLALLFFIACDNSHDVSATTSPRDFGTWRELYQAKTMPDGTKCWVNEAGNASSIVCNFPEDKVSTRYPSDSDG